MALSRFITVRHPYQGEYKRMQKLAIGICDDEEIMLGILQDLIEEAVRGTRLEYEILAFSSGDALLQQAKRLEIVFLDIDMPGMDGIETGLKLRRENPKCAIIMATGMEERYKEAFHVQAVRFVTKPFVPSEIEEAIEACLRRRIGLGIVEAYKNRNPYQVCQRDIAYVVSYGSYVELVVQGKRFRKEVSMEEMERMLEERMFFRVHRKYLVNLFWVETYENGTVLLAGQEIPVARRKKKEFERAYVEFDLKYRDR